MLIQASVKIKNLLNDFFFYLQQKLKSIRYAGKI